MTSVRVPFRRWMASILLALSMALGSAVVRPDPAAAGYYTWFYEYQPNHGHRWHFKSGFVFSSISNAFSGTGTYVAAGATDTGGNWIGYQGSWGGDVHFYYSPQRARPNCYHDLPYIPFYCSVFWGST